MSTAHAQTPNLYRSLGLDLWSPVNTEYIQTLGVARTRNREAAEHMLIFRLVIGRAATAAHGNRAGTVSKTDILTAAGYSATSTAILSECQALWRAYLTEHGLPHDSTEEPEIDSGQVIPEAWANHLAGGGGLRALARQVGVTAQGNSANGQGPQGNAEPEGRNTEPEAPSTAKEMGGMGSVTLTTLDQVAGILASLDQSGLTELAEGVKARNPDQLEHVLLIFNRARQAGGKRRATQRTR